MHKDAIRTTIDLPGPIYRKLKAQAARQGCSVRDLLLSGAQKVLISPQRPTKRVKFPLIDSREPRVKLTNERLYELIESL